MFALAEMKQAERDEAPLGGWAGELSSVPESHDTGLSWGPGLVIEPVDWDQEERERLARLEKEEDGC